MTVGTLLAAAGPIGACSHAEGDAPLVGTDVGAADGESTITIGVSNALSGNLGPRGAALANGVKVAETQINAAGGVLGRNVRFELLDDMSDELSSTDDGGLLSRTVATLLSSGAVAVLGPIGSSQVAAVQGALHDQQVIEISATATSVLLSGPTTQPLHDRYLFRTVPADDLQGLAVVKFAISGPPRTGTLNSTGSSGDAGIASDAGIANDAGSVDAAPPNDAGSVDAGLPIDAGAIKDAHAPHDARAPVDAHAPEEAGAPAVACSRMAIIYASNAYGTSMADVIRSAFPAKSGGGTIVADVAVDTTVKSSYSAEVATIVSSKPECLAMVIYDDVADQFLTDFKAAITPPPSGWSKTFFIIGTDGVYTSAFIENGRTGGPGTPSVAEAVYGTNPDTNPLTREYADFARLYEAQFPLPPGATDVPPYASNQYDAAILVALAIAQAGGTEDKVKLRDALYAVSKDGEAHGPADLVGALTAIQNGFDIDYAGASGPVDLGDDGNVSAGYIVWQVANGTYQTVERWTADDLR